MKLQCQYNGRWAIAEGYARAYETIGNARVLHSATCWNLNCAILEHPIIEIGGLTCHLCSCMEGKSYRNLAERVTEATGWKIVNQDEAEKIMLSYRQEGHAVVVDDMYKLVPLFRNQRTSYYRARDIHRLTLGRLSRRRAQRERARYHKLCKGTGLNANEYFVAKNLERQGFTVLRAGWPDLLAFDEQGKVRLVEVKAGTDTLNERQVQMHDALKRLMGFNVEILSPAFGDRKPL